MEDKGGVIEMIEFEKPKYKMIKFKCSDCGKVHNIREDTIFRKCECGNKIRRESKI